MCLVLYHQFSMFQKTSLLIWVRIRSLIFPWPWKLRSWSPGICSWLLGNVVSTHKTTSCRGPGGDILGGVQAGCKIKPYFSKQWKFKYANAWLYSEKLNSWIVQFSRPSLGTQKLRTLAQQTDAADTRCQLSSALLWTNCVTNWWIGVLPGKLVVTQLPNRFLALSEHPPPLFLIFYKPVSSQTIPVHLYPLY